MPPEEKPSIPHARGLFLRALEEDKKGNFDAALSLYEQAEDIFSRAALDAKDVAEKQMLEHNAGTAKDRATKIKSTRVKINESEKSSRELKPIKTDITFDKVAGLADVKDLIKNKIIIPAQEPDTVAHYKGPLKGESGSGILLYGPPGCGKTYIAKAIAGECNAKFFEIKLSEVLSKWVGESERNMREIFAVARKNAPSVLFMDEIDAFGYSRQSSMQPHERQLISQFLTETDGFEKNERVILIGTTNMPWEIDVALRRSGRFEELIFVPPPDYEARLSLLRIHSGWHLLGDNANPCKNGEKTSKIQNMIEENKIQPLAPEIDFEELARLTLGFSGADIKHLLNTAADNAIEGATRGEEVKKDKNITKENVFRAFQRIKPSLSSWYEKTSIHIEESGESFIFTDLIDAIVEYKSWKEQMKENREKINDFMSNAQ